MKKRLTFSLFLLALFPATASADSATANCGPGNPSVSCTGEQCNSLDSGIDGFPGYCLCYSVGEDGHIEKDEKNCADGDQIAPASGFIDLLNSEWWRLPAPDVTAPQDEDPEAGEMAPAKKAAQTA